MRTLALLFSLLLAACELKADDVPAFDKGKRYIYEFKSRVATGVSDEVHQISGFGLAGQLVIQNDNDDVAFMLTDLKYGHMTGRLDHLVDEMPITWKKPEGEKATLATELSKPWWVKYDHGLIKSLRFDKDDHTPEWNIKKAITTLFQTDFRREGIDNLHLYTVQEDGIGGECDTLYSIGHYYEDDTEVPDHDNYEIMNVTKIRQYDSCKYRPHLMHTTFIGEMCRNCKQETFRPLKSVGRVNYGIKGKREDFTIEYIRSFGSNVLTPFTTNGQTTYSVVNQTYNLVKVEGATPIPKPGNTEEVTSLAYTFPHNTREVDQNDLKKAHYYNKLYDREYPERMAKAEQYLNELKNVIKEYGKESKYVWKFVEVFQKFSYDDLVQFFNKHVLGDDTGIKSFMYEILPFVGTKPSIVWAMELIESGKVGQSDAFEMIRKVPFYVKEPTYKLLEAVKEFGMKDSVKSDHKLYSASRMAYGTLIFRGCVEHLHNPHPEEHKTFIPKEKCTAMVQGLIKKFETLKEPIDLSIYMRAISNTRTEEAFEWLLTIVSDDKYEVMLRQAAIWELYPYINETEHDEKIVETLVPIFHDVNEDYALRIYAFEVLLHSFPSPSIFSSLVVFMSKERNEKLKSYIYATLTTFANTTDPCYDEYTEHAKQLLQFLDHWDRDIVRDSVNRVFSAYNEKYNFGRSTHVAMIPSNYSAFPRELYMRQSINLLGTNFDFFEMGYNSEGYSMVDKLFNSFMGPKGLRTPDHDIKNPTLKDVVEKLHLQEAQQHEVKPYEVYMKVFGQDIYVTRSILKDLKERTGAGSEIQWEDGKLTMNVQSVGYMNGEFIIPNEIGLPVTMKIDVPLAYHIGGSAHVTPKSKSFHAFRAEYNLRLAMDFTVYTSMVVEGSVYEHWGYALRTKGGVKLPLKGSIDVDLETKKCAMTYKPSTEGYDMVYYSSVPYLVSETWTPIEYTHDTTNKQYSVGHKYWGVGWTHNFTYNYFWNDYGSYRGFLKSFFKKASSYDDYYYLSDKWYHGTRSFADYILLNPTGKPFYYNMHYEPSTQSPTTEFVLTTERNYNKKYEGDKGNAVFKYTAELVGKGQTERHWTLDLHVSTSWPERDTRKVLLTYKRSPLPDYDSKPYEICYKGEVMYTDWTKAYTTFPADLKVQWNGRIDMGESCKASDATSIIVKATAEKSPEQLSMEKSSLHHYKKCQELSKKGQELNKYCWRVIKDNGRVDKITIDIQHENIHDKARSFFYRFYYWFRATFYNNMEVDHFHGTNDDKKLKIVANISYWHPLVDIKVERPHKTFYYNRIYIPSILPQWTPFTVVVPKWERYFARIFNYHVPKCFISSKFIRTFDDVLYKAPIGDCWYLVFSDADKYHTNVLFRADKGSKDKKAIKVLFENDEVEIVPQGDQFIVKVNGEQKLTDKSAYLHMVDEELHFVVYKYSGKYVIASKYYGMYVTYDGVKSMIKSSNFYRGKQLGLCGNFDGEKVDEFEGPNGRVYHDAADFTRSYGVEKDGCSLN